jgi:transposase-like protein
MEKNLYATLKEIIHHPEKKKMFEKLLIEKIKDTVKDILETIILEERKIFCEEHGDVGNGYFLRSLKTPVGEIKDLKVARTRKKNFRTALFEPYSRDFLALDELIYYMYAGGCSTRDISCTLEKIFGFKYSPAGVSRITSVVAEKIEKFRRAPITKWYPVLWIDGTYHRFRRNGVVEKEVVYFVMGLSEEGYKEILGFWIPGGNGESALNWKEILKELYDRGLREPLLIVGDNLPGLESAVKLIYPLVDFQSCVLHKIRNTLNKVRKRDKVAVAEDLKRIYETHSESDWEFGFERFIKEVKRRAKVIEVFPDDQAIEKVVYFVVEEMNEKYSRKKLKNFERIIEELRELRRARYGEKEIRIITNEEKFYTQKY